jgi:hypothetical protein
VCVIIIITTQVTHHEISRPFFFEAELWALVHTPEQW